VKVPKVSIVISQRPVAHLLLKSLIQKTKKIACHKDTLKVTFKQSPESIWERARESDSNSSSPVNKGSFADMDQSVDNIIKGFEKGANKAKVPDHTKGDDNTSGHVSQKNTE
jgi:hypothetical protein